MEYQKCPHCGTDSPMLPKPDHRGMGRIYAVMDSGRRETAIFEAAGFLRCDHAIALQWLSHIESCPRWWQLTPACEALAFAIDAAFATVPKPEHFTNPACCAECHEHDQTLRQYSRESVPRAAFGSPGWSGLALCSAEGLLYDLPALARYTFVPYSMGHGDLRERVSTALGPNGKGKEIASIINETQRAALEAYLDWLVAGFDDGGSD